MKQHRFTVGSNGIVFTVSRPSSYGGICAREWITRHGLVQVFPTQEKAEKVAQVYNKHIQ
jgi:hypothetical protein